MTDDTLIDLAALTEAQLETLAARYADEGQTEAEEACLEEMLRRDYWPSAWFARLCDFAP